MKDWFDRIAWYILTRLCTILVSRLKTDVVYRGIVFQEAKLQWSLRSYFYVINWTITWFQLSNSEAIVLQLELQFLLVCSFNPNRVCLACFLAPYTNCWTQNFEARSNNVQIYQIQMIQAVIRFLLIHITLTQRTVVTFSYFVGDKTYKFTKVSKTPWEKGHQKAGYVALTEYLKLV